MLLGSSNDRLTVVVTASKGYYVRALARDLGEALGVPAHLSALTRTRSGAFGLADAVRWPPDELPPLVPVAVVAKKTLPYAELTAGGATKARLGQRLAAEHFVSAPAADGAHAFIDPEGRLVALGERTGDGYRVLRGFRG